MIYVTAAAGWILLWFRTLAADFEPGRTTKNSRAAHIQFTFPAQYW